MPDINIPKPTLFTTPGCVQCHAVKRYFDQHGIAFQEIDVTTSPQAEALVKTDWKYTKAPVVYYNFRHFSGFNPDELATIKNHYIQDAAVA